MYRKGVIAIILNNKNQILLVNLTNFKENLYSIPGGGSEVGENNIETLHRKLFEELNLSSNLIDIIKNQRIFINSILNLQL